MRILSLPIVRLAIPMIMRKASTSDSPPADLTPHLALLQRTIWCEDGEARPVEAATEADRARLAQQ